MQQQLKAMLAAKRQSHKPDGQRLIELMLHKESAGVETLSVVGIANALGLAQGQVSRILSVYERAGIVNTQADPSHGSRKLKSLNASAMWAVEKLFANPTEKTDSIDFRLNRITLLCNDEPFALVEVIRNWAEPEPCTQAAIVRKTGKHQPQVSRNLTRLKMNDLVEQYDGGRLRPAPILAFIAEAVQQFQIATYLTAERHNHIPNTMQGFQIIEADQPLEVKTLFTVLYGLPGVGKTSAAFTGEGNTILFDADNGFHRAVGLKRPPTVRIEKYADFWRWVQSSDFEKMVRDRELKNAAIDTVGSLLEGKMAPWLISSDPKNGNAQGGLTLQGWGSLKTAFSALVNRLTNLGLSITCVCHAKEEGEGNNQRFALAVAGGSADIIYRTADLIGLVQVVGDQRRVNFTPSNQHVAKNIGGIPLQVIPDVTTEPEQYSRFLADVTAEAKRNISAAGVSLEQFKVQLDEWETAIGAASTADGFDKLVNAAKEITGKSLQLQVRAKLVAAMTANGFQFKEGKVQAVEAQQG